MRKIVPHDAVLVPDNAERVFQGIVYDIYQWQQRRYDGSETTFEMIKRWDTLSIIGVVDQKLLVVEEEQPHAGSSRGFPGGRLDAEDDSVLQAAQREMLEETGYTFADWRLVHVRQPFVKIEWFIHTYLATNVLQHVAPQHDPGEKITIRHESFDTVKKLTNQGAGYFGEYRGLFEPLSNLQDLLDVSDFSGKEVDR